MLTIGEKIRQMRKRRSMTQKELAIMLGIGKRTLSLIELNKTSVKSDYVYILCDIFNCDANTLFGIDGVKQ